MADILLTTLNSRYHHSSFGLRYLYANLGEKLQSRSKIIEFTIQKRSDEIVQEILNLKPKIVGFGVYIWNTEQTLDVLKVLRMWAPEVMIVLGGPEVSFETEAQEHIGYCDYIVQGEADFLFRDLLMQLFSDVRPGKKIVSGSLPKISEIKWPYEYYTDEDIKNRVIYVEASRGCPYKCEYCLSSLDVSVRNFDTAGFLAQMQSLIDRGVRRFKFVDRTFNLSPAISSSILRFFLERVERGLFLHFEMVPDRLPQDLKDLILKFPVGSLQFEVGIQTWSPEVAKNVSRRQDYTKIRENLKFLKVAHVHSHADLIVGLPGETMESFLLGFDELFTCGPDEVQVGVLKRLKGTPITKKAEAFAMVYEAKSPFTIQKTRDMDESAVQRLSRFGTYWNLIGNSGRFLATVSTLRDHCRERGRSFARVFLEISDGLWSRHGRTYGLSPDVLAVDLMDFFSTKPDLSFMIEVVDLDLRRAREYRAQRERASSRASETQAVPSRQKRHREPLSESIAHNIL